MLKLALNYLLMNDERKLIRELANIEYGVSLFCSKLAIQAKGKHDDLAKLLTEHSNQELKHGRMLGSLADGRKAIRPNASNGHWVEEAMPGYRQVSWGNRKRYYKNFDGLNQRYFSFKIFFMGAKPSTLEWCDKIAFMCILEELSQLFYRSLGTHAKASEPLKAIACQIAEDEKHHADYLEAALYNLGCSPDSYLNKWRIRSKVAFMGLIFDIWKMTRD